MFFRKTSQIVLSLACAILLTCPATPGQNAASPPSQGSGWSAVPPALVVEENGKPHGLEIAKVEIDTRLTGPLEETRMTIVFSNPHARPLEGQLHFPLPPGATICGYALDIQGAMVEGVVVEKHKARIAFEQEVRKGVDPGLVEWTKGNSFQTRIFPIPARGTRTVMVKYVAQLPAGDKAMTWRLPLNFKDKLPAFSLKVEAVRPAGPPEVLKGGPPGLKFTRSGESYLAEADLKDVALPKDLHVAIPLPDAPQVLIEKSSDGQVYFCVNDVPRKFDVTPAAAPHRLEIYWDASGSRAAGDVQRQLGLLKRYLARFSNDTIEVSLVVFRNDFERVRGFSIIKGDSAGLLSAIEAIQYDGGTQLGVLPAIEAKQPPELALLFTDGLSNLGADTPRLNTKMHVISADPLANHALLASLAETHNGRYIDLLTTDENQAAQMLANSVAWYQPLPAEGTEEVFPSRSTPAEGAISVVGKLTAGSAKLALSYSQGRPVTLDLSADRAIPGEQLRRLWANRKLNELLMHPDRNAKAIVELGQKHSIVTPGTSLIVLENLEQYVEHKICPPKSLGEVRNKYLAIMDEQAAKEKAKRQSKLDRVLEMWNQRVKWWETEFKAPKDFKYDPAKLSGDSSYGGAPSPVLAGGAPRAVTNELRRDIAPSLTPAAASPPRTVVGSSGGLFAAADPGSDGDGAGRPGANTGQPAIVIKEWDPKTPYLAILKKAAPEKQIETYYQLRPKYAHSPAFFMDCGEFFLKNGQAAFAVQVFSNVAELELESPALLRVLAYRYYQMGQLELAIGLFEEVLRLRPEEPQSCRDLALVLPDRAKAKITYMQMARQTPEAARKMSQLVQADYQYSLDLLAKVVMGEWDRFEEIEVIALLELNRIWVDYTKAFPQADAQPPVDRRLLRLTDCDVRIVMTWDADNTDMDLHVIEPSGEEAFYSHNRTTIGGLVSKDFTQGYGPEEYLVKKAARGMYKIQSNYYGSSAARLQGPVTVQVDVFTNFGRPNQQKKSLTLRLTEHKETITVGEIEF